MPSDSPKGCPIYWPMWKRHTLVVNRPLNIWIVDDDKTLKRDRIRAERALGISPSTLRPREMPMKTP